MKKIVSLLIALTLSVSLFTGCGGETEVARVAVEPATFSLIHNQPEVFSFKAPSAGKYNLYLDVTYYTLQMQDNETLKLYTMLNQGEKLVNEKRFSIACKKDNAWQGTVVENSEGQEYTIREKLYEGLQLEAGDYAIKLLSDDQDKDILGMSRLTLVVAQ